MKTLFAVHVKTIDGQGLLCQAKPSYSPEPLRCIGGVLYIAANSIGKISNMIDEDIIEKIQLVGVCYE